MFSMNALLPELPRLRIVDVGALSLGAEKDPYVKLLRAAPCEVIGFEPIVAECARLNAAARPGCRYLPHAVGDGSEQVLRECNVPMTSSLLEPDVELLGMFHELREVTQVVARHPLRTVRLDDLPEVRGTDYLKLDVQGAELMVLQGAVEMLRSVLVLHTEVEFIPMYREQPLFADVDAFLRAQGFILHRLAGLRSASFKLPDVEVELVTAVNQAMWAEAVYVKDFRALDRLEAASLLKMAVILHENYASSDLAALVLAAHDRKAGTALTDHFVQLLFENGAAPA
jgi:FkbM family methyltransferase